MHSQFAINFLKGWISMDKEIQLLNHISNNANISQRELSRHTGMSLGSVNLFLKKLTQKGFIKIENMSSTTLKYILTPKGIKEKTHKTYNYIINSMQSILKIRKQIISIFDYYISAGYYKIYLYGSQNEFYELLQVIIKEENYDFEYVEDFKSFKDNDNSSDNNKLFICWELDKLEELKAKNLKGINIVELLN